jgi:PST family polysaccharide transporter
VVTAIAVYFYRRRPEKPRVKVSPQDVMKEGKGFMLLGVYMAISMFMGIVVSYLFMIYLNRSADTSMVGCYQAGYSLVNKYVGLIFTAIAMEYYPRLAQVIKSRKRTSTFVSHEVMLSVWIIIPVIALFIAADDLIVNIFYSEEFSVIIPFISCAVIGTIFRAVSFCIAYVILARGDGKVYLITETTSAVIGLTLNIVFFEAFGMLGLGISYILWYMLYALIVYVVYRYNYGLRMGQGISRLMIYAVAMGIASVTLSVYVGWWATAIVAVVTLYFSARRLLRRR